MPTVVTFNYEKTHTVGYKDGYVKAIPALTTSSRLYVIYNATTTHPVYVGTSDDVQNRFGNRIDVCRELGYSQAQMDPISIFVVQIKIDGTPMTPGQYGVSGGIDVEHLLIRTYLRQVNVNVRNAVKLGIFTNSTGGKLSWNLENNAGIANFGTHNYYLNNNQSF